MQPQTKKKCEIVVNIHILTNIVCVTHLIRIQIWKYKNFMELFKSSSSSAKSTLYMSTWMRQVQIFFKENKRIRTFEIWRKKTIKCILQSKCLSNLQLVVHLLNLFSCAPIQEKDLSIFFSFNQDPFQMFFLLLCGSC